MRSPPRGVALVASLLLVLAAACSGNDAGYHRPPAIEPGPTDADQDGSPVGADGDCDDADPTVHPGAAEIAYDGIDQDCDGADLSDPDGDGHLGYEGGGTDCDDADPAVHPGAADPCGDLVDQDCDGVDVFCEDVDVDRDGWSVAEGDCRDDDPAIHPGTEDVPYDGIDQDCRNGDRIDVDGDGWPAERAGGADCDDGNAGVFPGAAELCDDGVDADCSGADRPCPPPPVDADGDGYAAASSGGDDCDDAREDVNPGEMELPGDDVDQNCDGEDVFRAYPVVHVPLPPGTRAVSMFWDGSVYRLIWQGDHAWGQTPLDRSGAPLGEAVSLETFEDTKLSSVGVAVNEGSVLVLVEEMLSPDGQPRRTTVRPLDATMAPGAVVELPSRGIGRLFAGPGENFLYFDAEAPLPEITVLSPAGTRVGGRPAAVDPWQVFGVARFPGGALVGVRRDEDLWGFRVGPTGALLAGEALLLHRDGHNDPGPVSLLGGPEAHLLLADRAGVLEGRWLDPVTGAVQTRIDVSDPAYLRAITFADCLAVGRSFFLIWDEHRWPRHSGPVAQWIGPGGTPIGSPAGTNLPLASLADDRGGPVFEVATDGTDVLLWWSEGERGYGPISVMRIPNPGGDR